MPSNHPSFELFHLLQHPRIERRHAQKLLLHDPKLTKFRQQPLLLEKTLSFPKPMIHQVLNYLNDLHTRQHSYQHFKQYNPLTIYDSKFPQSLASIPDPPLILYTRGHLELLQEPSLSVIGSRKPSQTAQRKIEHIIYPLIKKSIPIVSGLAYGIDSMAHRFCLNEGGNTIAVLGYGFNHIYPKAHQNLFDAIGEYGLLISEYPPETPPQRWHFPERNRIISGLSRATLIVEAAMKSGTMITANQALDQGRDVLVIPDSIFLKEAKGCLKLLQEGATPVTDPEDLIEAWEKLSLSSQPY